MPELPEVEAIRRYLIGSNVIGTRIRSITSDSHRLQTSTCPIDAAESQIRSIARRGKYLELTLKPARKSCNALTRLILHMGMTGSLHITPINSTLELRHIRASFKLSDDRQIDLNDPRRWSKIWLASTRDKLPIDKLGPELSDLEALAFAHRLRQRNQRIKPALLDQSLVAGIGNIYADESLHAAGISPKRRTSNISIAWLTKLHAVAIAVLERATNYIVNNPSPDGSPYVVNAYDERITLQRRGHPNAKCPTCRGKLSRIKINARTTIHCKSCQT